MKEGPSVGFLQDIKLLVNGQIPQDVDAKNRVG
jgi:hypothetical protein